MSGTSSRHSSNASLPQPPAAPAWPQALRQGLRWYLRRGVRVRLLLLFFLVTLGSVGLIGYFGYQSTSEAHHSKAEELVAGYTTEVAGKMTAFQAQVQADLRFLGAYRATLRYLYWQDLRDAEKADYWKSLVNDLLLEFANAAPYYYKIRFIDAEGVERLGVRRDPLSGQTQAIDASMLGNKQAADYFQHGMQLRHGEVFAGAISPNTEHGKIELPQVPVMRLVTPVIGDNGVHYGVLVVSVLAEHYFRFVREADALSPERHFLLIDAQGNYLLRPHGNSVREVSSLPEARFDGDFPGMLEAFRAQGSNGTHTLAAQGHILSFKHIRPNPGQEQNSLILVGMSDETTALAELHAFALKFAGLLLAVALLVLLAVRYFVNGLLRPLEVVTRQMQHLGRGEIDPLTEIEAEYLAEDEFSRLLDSSRKQMLSTERLSVLVDSIAQGDFSRSVPLLSEHDRLGKALNNMTLMLRESREAERRSNWLKDGLSQLSLALMGDLRLKQLADTASSQLVELLEAGHGIFYQYDPASQHLVFLGGCQVVAGQTQRQRFELGEGTVGQAGRDRRPIVLHAAIDAALADAAPVLTGTLSLPPLHTYTHPLLREGELLGVLEIAAFTGFDDLQQVFLQRASEVIASFLYVAEQREQIRQLLQAAEITTQQALQQAAELQAANALMETQQQQLQQQSEELQQSNAHLEEQQRQMEEQARELEIHNQALNESRHALDERARELEQASRYKSEFLANMSHELRTPLNSIILLSKMLALNEDRHLSAEETKRASVIHRGGEELLRLINDILDLSKIEAGHMPLYLQRLSSRELAENFHDQFAALALEKGLEFRIEDAWQGELVADGDKLVQVVRNLLANAFKFTRTGGVTLRFVRSARADLPLCIAVADTGIGIPLDKQQLVFEAFQQVDGSISREYGGTGLGLSISQRFTELMGGVIELQSAPGAGSEFRLLLPLPALSAATPTAPELAATGLASPERGGPQPTLVDDDRARLKASAPLILVIDDDPDFGEILVSINQRLGYQTLVATSGREGLRMARAYRPRGILLDLELPDIDGSAVLHQLKRDSELRRVPVYLVSAHDDSAAHLRDDIAGYLRKPVSESQLAAAQADVLALAERGEHGLLLLEGGALQRDKLAGLLHQESLKISAVSDLPAAVAALRSEGWRLAVVDLTPAAGAGEGKEEEGEGGTRTAIAICEALRAVAAELHLILYSEQALSKEAEALLRPYTDSIILKSAQAEQRMLENIERFLRQMPAAPDVAGSLAGGALKDDKKLAGRHILVVDDDPRNLFVITAALEQQGARVTSALNGRKGLEALREQPVDLVFMDLMMPEMDGYEAIHQLRADPALQHLPVIALTAKTLKADREKALATGADDYLSKPVDYEVLVNMARIWCEEKA